MRRPEQLVPGDSSKPVENLNRTKRLNQRGLLPPARLSWDFSHSCLETQPKHRLFLASMCPQPNLDIRGTPLGPHAGAGHADKQNEGRVCAGERGQGQAVVTIPIVRRLLWHPDSQAPGALGRCGGASADQSRAVTWAVVLPA